MNTIPKKIHYCWFGRNPKPELALKCIESWKKNCPEYEIVEWNEDNFDMNQNLYVKQAYEAKKYAFVSDYARLYALYNYGGIYMDTDVEVLKNFNEFLSLNAFTCFESNGYITTGVIGATKENPWIKDMLNEYTGLKFIKDNGEMDLTTNVARMSGLMKEKYGLNSDNVYQNLNDIVVVYPNDFFSPKDWSTGKINCTENTHTIHHFSGSWHDEKQQKEVKKLQEKANRYIEKYGEEEGRKKFNKHETYMYYLKNPSKAIKRVCEKVLKRN